MSTTTDPRGNINEWNASDVCLFFSNLGFPQFEEAILENDLTGDLLMAMDADEFKDLGLSVGQRLAVLKAVYLVKLAHDIPMGPEDYVPPTEAAEKREEASVGQQDGITVDNLHELLKGHAQRLLQVEEENRVLRTTLHSALEDLNRRIMQGEESPLSRSKSFKWPDFIKPARSPTKAETFESPQPSPRHAETDGSRTRPATTVSEVPSSRISAASTAVETPIASHPKPSRQDSMDNLKSFKVSLEDPAWKVLPAALKKYKINNDDWQNYAMFICYGSAGNRVERCLSYDEKPLLLFQKLKDGKKNPVFMLKHIKDIRSPIAVAQQKHAARKASSGDIMTSPPNGTPSGHAGRLPRLQVTQDMLAHVGPATGSALQTGWPELMSPAVESKPDGQTELLAAADGAPKIRTGSPGHEGEQSRAAPSGHGAAPREMPPMQGISYAVAIYPYMAEQEDEFDVVVGDAFIILSRARGWWVVQRDQGGSGQVDVDASKQGWVPAGCLLETKVPVASAIAEANAALGFAGVSSPLVASPVDASRQQKKRPILPLSIVSTSFPGVALMEYQGKGEEELDLVKDEPLRVFKRYNHWSYAVKEDGERGWVPSWYIGKVATPSDPRQGPPPSPGLTGTMDDGIAVPHAAQASPMSTAFPVRTTVVS